MACLEMDKAEMLVFYDYAAETWRHIRTTNLLELVFATVQLLTHKMKNCGSRITTLTTAFKLMATAQKRWHRLRGSKHLANVITGVKFVDGIK
jgi:putative transposase